MSSKWLPTITVIFIMLVGFSSFAIRCNRAEQATAKIQIDLNKAQEFMRSQSIQLELAENKLIEANTIIEDLKNSDYNLIYLGDFKLTHYCTEAFEHICGIGAGITATGTQVTSGRSIAVDPTVIPYGSHVYIEGYGWRIAEDTGGAIIGNHIDIAVDTHKEALALGTTMGGIWILIPKTS